jgi:hypothetical protein
MSFMCPVCHRTSHNPNDEAAGYCGACHDFTGTPQPGCSHREHEGTATCSKLCNPGDKLCPHHKLLAEATAQAKEKRQQDRKAEEQRAKVRNRRQ